MKLSAASLPTTSPDEGKWINDIPGTADLRLCVRNADNMQFRAMRDRLIVAIRRDQIATGLLPQIRGRIEGECLARTVLLDWENLTDDAGTVIPYEPGLALQMLTNPEFEIFRRAVQWAANVASIDSMATEAEEAGKLSPHSNGSTNGAIS